MSDKLPVEDLTREPEQPRTDVIDVPLSSEQVAELQKQADARGVTLEEYALGIAITAAAVTDAGGNPFSGGTA